MPRFLASLLLVFHAFDCVAANSYLHGFDFRTCTSWEFNTDIVAYNNQEFLAATTKAQALLVRQTGWVVYQAINHKSYGQELFGVCRYVLTPSNRPAKFECEDFGTFPLSGSTFSVVKDRGLFSSSYRCTKSCASTAVHLIHDQTSEDKGNIELGENTKKFNNLCQRDRVKNDS